MINLRRNITTHYKCAGLPQTAVRLLHIGTGPFILLFLVKPFLVMAMASPQFTARVRALDEFDPLAPQREAALFYGLFLRGHSAEALRRDIELPRKLVQKLLKRHRNELSVQEKLKTVYQYRQQVLAIFDELVTREKIKERVH